MSDPTDAGAPAGGDLELAERVARAAGALLLDRYEGPARGLAEKSSRTDMVSDADRDAEALIRELLAAERPEDGLLGEEGSLVEGSSGRRWVVDPLDGTTNYLYRFPAWVVSVALEDGDASSGTGGALVGVVYDPLRDEAFTAARGGGARLNGAPIAVSGVARLDSALIGTGFGYAAERRAEQAAVAARLLPLVRDIRRAGAAALDLCMVACGRLDGYYERGLNVWDWAAGSLIAKEAGATVRPLPGEPFGLTVAPPAIADELAQLAT
ncbi:MAG TPA: inositol monophosphatase family protein [Thermoleophilaceae bacterium]|nr:inositol monophosphatase family protein [Thermoleophilaceae bacterium]